MLLLLLTAIWIPQKGLSPFLIQEDKLRCKSFLELSISYLQLFYVITYLHLNIYHILQKLFSLDTHISHGRKLNTWYIYIYIYIYIFKEYNYVLTMMLCHIGIKSIFDWIKLCLKCPRDILNFPQENLFPHSISHYFLTWSLDRVTLA